MLDDIPLQLVQPLVALAEGRAVECCKEFDIRESRLQNRRRAKFWFDSASSTPEFSVPPSRTWPFSDLIHGEIYVAPDCHGPTTVDAAEIVASGWLGRYRRDSGWGEWRGDPAHANESCRMDEVFARAGP